MKIYTKTGDAGSTGLFGGGRVPKDDPRVEAYGAVDELNAFIGVARSAEPMPRIDDARIGDLERAIDDADAELEPLRSFILPGGSPKAAALHVARTVCRRAERSAWAAWEVHQDTMNGLAIKYLNRLSDLLFILARHANRENGDVLWVPGGERSASSEG
jgi:cob(I)alamin adenosyltransferase